MDENELSNKIIGAALEVHRQLGPGLLESAYEACLCYELSCMNIPFQRQVNMPVNYKDTKLDCGFRPDLIVDGKVIVEVKAADKMAPIYDAQVLTYLKLSGLRLGLLINFNCILLKDGIKRLVSGLCEPYRPLRDCIEKEEKEE